MITSHRLYRTPPPAQSNGRAAHRGGSLIRLPYNPPVSVSDHRRDAPASIGCFVLTISDTRTGPPTPAATRSSRRSSGAGHHVAGRRIVRDEPDDGARRCPGAGGHGGRGHHDRRHRHHRRATAPTKRSRRCSTSGSTGSASCFACSSYAEIGSAAMLEPRLRRHDRPHRSVRAARLRDTPFAWR